MASLNSTVPLSVKDISSKPVPPICSWSPLPNTAHEYMQVERAERDGEHVDTWTEIICKWCLE